MAEVAKQIRFKTCDRRGRFRTIAMGVSYGGGQKVSTRPSSPSPVLMGVHSVLVLCVTLCEIKQRWAC